MSVVMFNGIRIDRHQIHQTMPNARFRADFLGEAAHILGRATQKQGFQTVFMIEVHVHGTDNQIVRMMLQMCQSLREVPFVMVIDIGKTGNAMRRLILIQPFGFDFLAQQIPHGLGAIDITPRLNPFIEVGGQFIAQGDSKTFQSQLL